MRTVVALTSGIAPSGLIVRSGPGSPGVVRARGPAAVVRGPGSAGRRGGCGIFLSAGPGRQSPGPENFRIVIDRKVLLSRNKSAGLETNFPACLLFLPVSGKIDYVTIALRNRHHAKTNITEAKTMSARYENAISARVYW
jgi:hypothetical protein